MKTRHTIILLLLSVLVLTSACVKKHEPAQIPDGEIETKTPAVTEKMEKTEVTKKIETQADTVPEIHTQTQAETVPEEKADPAEQPELIWKYEYDTSHINSIASFGETVATGHYCVCYIHHISDGRLLDAIELVHTAEVLEFSPDGVFLGAGQSMYGVLLTKLVGKLEQNTLFNSYNARLAFTPDSTHIATSERDGIIKIWELEGFSQTDTLIAPDLDEKTHMARWVSDLQYHPSGKFLAAVHDDYTIHIWDMENREVVRTLEYADAGMGRGPFAFSPNGKDMAYIAADPDNTLIRLLSVEDGKKITDYVEPTRYYRNMAFSPDGNMLAVVTSKNTSIWDVSSGEKLYTLDQEITSLDDEPFLAVFTDDGGHLAVVRADHILEMWRLPGADPIEPPIVDIKEPPPLPGDVLFDTNSAKIKQEAYPALEALAEELYDNFPEATITFIGHTDSQGDDDSNMTLSLNRARSVMDWFHNWSADKEDIAWTLLTDGKGESELKVSDVDAEGKFLNDAGSLNRRVEIEIEP